MTILNLFEFTVALGGWKRQCGRRCDAYIITVVSKGAQMPSRALVEAIKKGDFQSVRTIIATDPAALASGEDSASPVLTALYYGQADIADFLAPRADLDIFEAAASGRLDRLDEIIAADPDITRQSTDGWTPLHLAAFFGRTDAARRLIDAGADLRAIAANSTANTPLHAAIAGRGDEELVLRMLMAGADATVPTAEGYTPLHVAASRGDRRPGGYQGGNCRR